MEHFLELRQRGLWVLGSFVAFFLLFFLLSDRLFLYMVKPLLQQLPNHSQLIAVHITAPVFLPIKLAFHAAVLAAVPILLYQLWRFAAPGLYLAERGLFRYFIGLSSCLFISGVVFCYFTVLPIMFYFFSHAIPEEVTFLPDISYSIEFICRMLLLFGISFEIPLLCFIVVRLRMIDVCQLKTVRPYVMVGSFIIGMLLTPPDVLSQIMLAIPLCLLYEVGILLAYQADNPKNSTSSDISLRR